MQLSEDQIVDNWNEMLSLVENNFTDERKTKLLKMYEFFQDRMILMPASGKEHFHNSWPGGYISHILNVVKIAEKLFSMYIDLGLKTTDYTKENIVFCALNHDLGKVGDIDNDYYIPNESEWHRINQGKIYTFNSKLDYMTVTDRTIYLLNQFGIKMSKEEFLALRLADGLYEEYNKKYYVTFDDAYQIKTNLPFIIHHADCIATRFEYEQWKYSNVSVDKKVGTMKKEQKPKLEIINGKRIFDELFGKKDE